MDVEITRQLLVHLSQEPSWNEWDLTAWLRGQFQLDYDTSQAYLAQGVRQWGQAQEKNRPAAAGQLSPDLRRRLAEGPMLPADWVEMLQHGLYLERRAVLLTWGAPLASLEQLHPDKTPASPSIQTWLNETIFGGLPMKVSTCSLFSSRGLYRLNCTPDDYQIYGDLDDGLQPELQHLQQALGPPEPGTTIWRLGAVALSLEAYSPNDFYSSASYHKYLVIERLRSA